MRVKPRTEQGGISAIKSRLKKYNVKEIEECAYEVNEFKNTVFPS